MPAFSFIHVPSVVRMVQAGIEQAKEPISTILINMVLFKGNQYHALTIYYSSTAITAQPHEQSCSWCGYFQSVPKYLSTRGNTRHFTMYCHMYHVYSVAHIYKLTANTARQRCWGSECFQSVQVSV